MAERRHMVRRGKGLPLLKLNERLDELESRIKLLEQEVDNKVDKKVAVRYTLDPSADEQKKAREEACKRS